MSGPSVKGMFLCVVDRGDVGAAPYLCCPFFFLFPIFGIPNLPLPEDLPHNPGRGARQLGAFCAGPWLSCSFRVALKFFGETSPRTLDPRARDMIDGIPRVPFACGA